MNICRVLELGVMVLLWVNFALVNLSLLSRAQDQPCHLPSDLDLVQAETDNCRRNFRCESRKFLLEAAS